MHGTRVDANILCVNDARSADLTRSDPLKSDLDAACRAWARACLTCSYADELTHDRYAWMKGMSDARRRVARVLFGRGVA